MRNEETSVARFLARYREDAERASVRSLEDYLSEFPEDVESVARHWFELEGRRARDEGTDERRIGEYELLEELGRGAQGIVYRAKHRTLGREVALKVLRGVQADSGDAMARFFREARVVSRLDHPGICPLLDAGLEGATPFLAMRLVEGETLANLIARQRRDPREFASIHLTLGEDRLDEDEEGEEAECGDGSSVSQREMRELALLFARIADALQAAHSVGVIHRDVKPQNVMVDGAGDPVLLDFGLAHADHVDITTLTGSGDVFGTPAYMSPEQLLSDRGQLDGRTDVYSLGISLFEALTARRPYEASTRDRLYREILVAEFPSLSRLNPGIPRDLQVIVETAAARERNRRYATAGDLAADLRRFAARQTILARPPTLLARTLSWTRRNPVTACALAASTIAMLAITVISWNHGREMEIQRNDAARLAEAEKHARVSYGQLADSVLLDELDRRRREELWPRTPALRPRLAVWTEDLRGVQARFPEHARALESWSDQSPEGLDRKMRLARFLAREEALEDIAREGEQLRGGITSLERLCFEESAEVWARIEKQTGSDAAFVEHPVSRGMPLVPLGMSAATGLWEFWNPLTGARPERDAEAGHWIIREETGMVFVLLPGGTVSIGADKIEDEAAPGYDGMINIREHPRHDVVLDPFLISAFEVTRAQWLRLGGEDRTQVDPFAEAHADLELVRPVGNVTWDEAVEILARGLMRLPSESQWEYAARAGAATRWSFGDSIKDGNGAMNGFDRYAFVVGQARWQGDDDDDYDRELDDGFLYSSPVGWWAPNAFGLHDVHGNVFEWCLDGYTQGYVLGVGAPGTGERPLNPENGHRILRGGSFGVRARDARLTHRGKNRPDTQFVEYGMRPVIRLRDLEPDRR